MNVALVALLLAAPIDSTVFRAADGGWTVRTTTSSTSSSSSGASWFPDGGFIGSVFAVGDGGVAVTNWPATQPVSAASPISVNIVDAGPQAVFGNVTVTGSVTASGTVGVTTSAPINAFVVDAGAIQVFGTVADSDIQAADTTNGGAVPANVLAVGVETATQGTTQPTAASAGTLRRPVGSTDGALYVRNGGPVNWQCSLDAIAASLTQCQAAPSAGLRLYVTDITIGSTTATAGQFILRQGTGSNCGTGTASLFPSAATVARFAYPANTSASGSAKYSFTTPLQLTAANALCILCVATNTCTVSIQGYTAP